MIKVQVTIWYVNRVTSRVPERYFRQEDIKNPWDLSRIKEAPGTESEIEGLIKACVFHLRRHASPLRRSKKEEKKIPSSREPCPRFAIPPRLRYQYNLRNTSSTRRVSFFARLVRNFIIADTNRFTLWAGDRTRNSFFSLFLVSPRPLICKSCRRAFEWLSEPRIRKQTWHCFFFTVRQTSS